MSVLLVAAADWKLRTQSRWKWIRNRPNSRVMTKRPKGSLVLGPAHDFCGIMNVCSRGLLYWLRARRVESPS